MFILDTNVISEATKPRPNSRVVQWSQIGLEQTFISAMTIGEIVKGIARLSTGRRRKNLERWLGLLTSPVLRARILPIDDVIGAEWGRLNLRLRRTLPCADSLIAATARVHDLTVATRNERDFADFGVRIFNPWLT